MTIGGDAPYFVTFQSGSFRGDNAEKGSAAVETMEVAVGDIRMKPEAPFQEAKATVDLTKSEIIVAVGRGIKSQENIALAQQLADALGADLAASRPIWAMGNHGMSSGGTRISQSFSSRVCHSVPISQPPSRRRFSSLAASAGVRM